MTNLGTETNFLCVRDSSGFTTTATRRKLVSVPKFGNENSSSLLGVPL